MVRSGLDPHPQAAWRDGPLHAWARAGLAIGLFGGSFNPAHGGHRHAALAAMTLAGLDRVAWLVAPRNPLKSPSELADYAARVDSARAQARHPRMAVSECEGRLGLMYTALSVRRLRAVYPHARFVWIMGADSFLLVHRWRAWRAIFASAPVAVIPRPGAAMATLRSVAAQHLAFAQVPAERARTLAHMPPPAWTILAAQMDARSATAIRARGQWP
jgi:nicotinate-nucleotide adenylyltransferase